MKRTILAAIALTFLAAPAAYADYRPSGQHDKRYEQNFNGRHDSRAERGNSYRKGDWEKPRHNDWQKPSWKKGSKLSDWKRRQAVRDYHRYGLRKPARDQQWVRIGNDFLLISTRSGIVINLFGGR